MPRRDASDGSLMPGAFSECALAGRRSIEPGTVIGGGDYVKPERSPQ